VDVSLDGWIPEKRTVRVEPRGKAEVSFELKPVEAASPEPDPTPVPAATPTASPEPEPTAVPAATPTASPEPEPTAAPAATPDASPETAGPLPPAEEPAPTSHGPLWTGGWVVAGIGAAVAIAGGITGGAALSKGKALDSDYPDGVPRDKKDDMDQVDRMAITTNVLLGVGGAAVVAGVVLLILDDGPAERDVALLPAAGPSFAGAALAGRF
jgi:hypothetical protein